MCRDMEMSCDEIVIEKMGQGIKKEYSASLLSLASGRRMDSIRMTAFGEGNVFFLPAKQLFRFFHEFLRLLRRVCRRWYGLYQKLWKRRQGGICIDSVCVSCQCKKRMVFAGLYGQNLFLFPSFHSHNFLSIVFLSIIYLSHYSYFGTVSRSL